MEGPVSGGRPLSRRALIGTGAAAAATMLSARLLRVPAGSAATTCVIPPSFPAGIALYQQAYENWAQQIVVEGVWTCAPRTPQDVVTLANWAAAHGYALRARGMMHGWSPLTVTPEATCATPVVLVDTTRHLTAIELASSSPAAVRVQTGATMDMLLGFLEARGYGMTATPAPGDISVGGALAIGAHGTAVPVAGEESVPGHTFGSLSNLIMSLTAVVWSRSQRRYVLRRFDRSEHDAKAFLVHLGRTIVTEVELRTGANTNLRCQSFTDIPATTMFASPATAGPDAFASYLQESGRVEAIWYPFTTNPWLKVWSVTPARPAAARVVSQPYNYVFSDVVPVAISELITQIIGGAGALTPAYGAAQYAASVAGLAATLTSDIWGPSRDLLLYILPTTVRETANGYAVLCRRGDVQRVVSEFATFFTAQVAAYRARGSYPVNMPVEIRVTGRDQPGDVGVRGAQSPVLGALHPRRDRPEWDTAVWIDVLTFPQTRDSVAFYRQLEQWFFSNFRSYASVRPEWSKGWAYGTQAAWSDPIVLGRTIPQINTLGRASGDDWAWALGTLERYDPHRIFTNAFLDRLMPAPAAR